MSLYVGKDTSQINKLMITAGNSSEASIVDGSAKITFSTSFDYMEVVEVDVTDYVYHNQFSHTVDDSTTYIHGSTLKIDADIASAIGSNAHPVILVVDGIVITQFSTGIYIFGNIAWFNTTPFDGTTVDPSTSNNTLLFSYTDRGNLDESIYPAGSFSSASVCRLFYIPNIINGGIVHHVQESFTIGSGAMLGSKDISEMAFITTIPPDTVDGVVIIPIKVYTGIDNYYTLYIVDASKINSTSLVIASPPSSLSLGGIVLFSSSSAYNIRYSESSVDTSGTVFNLTEDSLSYPISNIVFNSGDFILCESLFTYYGTPSIRSTFPAKVTDGIFCHIGILINWNSLAYSNVYLELIGNIVHISCDKGLGDSDLVLRAIVHKFTA